MKTQKIKRYRLGVSRNFPTTHARKGEETFFPVKIMSALGKFNDELGNVTRASFIDKKIHTIRSNYKLWAERMAEVQAGRAVIELFYWSGKPYHKDENGVGQVVFAILDKDSGCGVQKLYFSANGIDFLYTDFGKNGAMSIPTETLAKNDGLSLDDFKAWFKKYDLSEPMAIIHFTKFRY